MFVRFLSETSFSILLFLLFTMEFVAEPLLSASVETLFKMLGSSELIKFAREKKIDAELNKWETTLRRINALLHDAEEKQLTHEGVKIWFANLQHLAYDIEDVLDEFGTETLKRKVMKDKLRKLVSSSCCSFAFKRKMASGIEHITARLEDIAQQEQSLNLLMNATGTRSKQLKEWPPTTSLVNKSYFYGRNDEKEAIVQKLLKDEVSNNPISVFAIVGMGGIGKTTLAQQVYNHDAIKNYFDIKVWVCVSENFDVDGLTRTILRKVDSGTRDLNNLDLDSLQETLKGKLSQKKFLLILDDVWEEDYSLWDQLRTPFFSAASRGKIIVTTRKNNAAPIRDDVHVYRVKELPNDECMCLLAFHALGAANSFEARPELKDIGEELVKRCNGLPLAAKVLGGLLRNKRSREEWERVLRNSRWKTSNSVHPTLKLSYDDLPSHLKRCFTYCAIFPKDYEFGRDEMVRLWMAEGFLQHQQGGMLMEDLGIEYFDDLVSRSFFQRSSSNEFFVMHDLISDLAQTIAGDICYNYENKIEVNKSSSKYKNVRHASYFFYEKSQVYSGMKRLRTIWRGREFFRDLGDHEKNMVKKLLARSKCMRVLSLRYCPIKELSNSIGDLIHLRYIDLSGASIQRLPESVSNLFNLQTLLLDSCDELVELPDKIGNLVNLLHLDISHTYGLQKLPSSIGMLTNLQTLPNFTVNEGDETAIAVLKNLNRLRGSLFIEGLEYVQDAESAILKGKQGLEELELKWSGGHGRNDVSVLESLEPHQNLKRLTISGYGGAEFPSWMINNHLFSKLVFLHLRECSETKVLPPLGQLCSLKELIIQGLNAVKSIGVEFYGNAAVPFRSLERLEIIRMLKWNEWSHGDQGFPHLQQLRIYDCPKLIGSLPSELHGLRHLSELEIEECGSLVSFPPMGLPCCLKRIEVRWCDALQCFPIIYTDDSEQSLLEELYIESCSSLTYFQRNFKLPNSLRILQIRNCGNLLSLPDGLMVQDDKANQSQSQSQSHLEHLEIWGCQRLTAVTPGKFPAALKFLKMLQCSLQLESPFSGNNKALETIVISKNNNIKALPSIDCLPNLKELYIFDCPALESFPEMGFLSTSLQNLVISDCQNLPLPPILMQSHFPSLRELMISNCPNVASLVGAGGVPQNLTTLEISYCEKLRQPIAEWGLGMLSSLETLEVSGRCPATSDVKLLPDDNCWLPTSLKTLYINNFINLESVSMGLRRLTSLEDLHIRYCPKLRSLPKGALPFSVKKMYIGDCPLLKEDDFSEREGLFVKYYEGALE